MDNGKFIYVILSATYSKIGRAIRIFTRSVYNHASISFDENMNEVYSFARIYYCTPFIGGPVKETYDRFCLNKPQNVSVKVYKIPVTDEGYDRALARVHEIFSDGEYAYNLISAFTFLFRHGVERYKTFTCSEFVSHILKTANEKIMPDIADCKMTPDGLAGILEPFEYYSGPLSGFVQFNESKNVDFFDKIGFTSRWYMTYIYLKTRYGKNYLKHRQG